MTDARFPERWLNDRRVVRLSDAGFRLLVTSLAYSVANRTDGRLDKADLELLHGVDARHVGELVDAGLMEATTVASWQSTVYAASQSSKSQLEGYEWKREQDRQRKANERARKRGEPEPFPRESRDSPRDVTDDGARDTKARPGQARQGVYGTTDQAKLCPHGKPLGDPWCLACRDSTGRARTA
jgi:predicted RNA-binding Zn ribbon-like protein